VQVKEQIKKLGSESLIYGLSGIFTKFISIFLVPFYTAVFSPADYGIIGLITNTFILVNILVVLALDNAAHRWFWEHEAEEERRTTINTWAWFQFGLTLLAGGVLFWGSDFLAVRFLESPDASLYLKINALALPLTSWVTVVTNVLRLQRRAKMTVVYTLSTSLLYIGLNVVFILWLGMGLAGIYYSQLIMAFVGMVWAFFLLRAYITLPAINQDRLREMLRYSVPFIPAGIAFWIVNLSGTYFLQFFTSTREVGLYQIGTTVATAAALVTNAFQQAWGPFALSIHKAENANQVYAQVLTLYTVGTSAICLLLTLFAPEILQVLTNPRYYDAAWVASILSFNYLLIGLGYIASIGLGIAKKTAPMGFIMTVSAGLIILFNFILVPIMGMEGSAVATFGAQAIVPLCLFYRSQKIYPIPYNFRAVGIVLLLALLLGFGTRLFLWQQEVGPYLSILFKTVPVIVFGLFIHNAGLLSFSLLKVK
jgi:O-antigen/teichoic acid export membrane protein